MTPGTPSLGTETNRPSTHALNSQAEPAELGKVKNSNQGLLTPSQVESHREASKIEGTRMLASGDCACAEDEEGWCVSSHSPVSPGVPVSPPVTLPSQGTAGAMTEQTTFHALGTTGPRGLWLSST